MSRSWATTAAVVFASLATASGQTTPAPGTTDTGSTAPVSQKMKARTGSYVCGGRVQAGTPIAGLGSASSNGTSGTITIKDVPPTANIVRADLFWSVLTYDTADTLPSSSIGQNIVFNGRSVSGSNVGRSAASPCFPQSAALAWWADVKALLTAPGNGLYSLSGFPGGGNFTEGVTLQILYGDANGPLMEDNMYRANPNEALAVTASNWFMQMQIGKEVRTNATGPVSVSLYPVVGNGQTNGRETLVRHGPCAALADNNIFAGNTTAKPANSCQSTMGTECYWDDGVLNFDSAYACPKGNSSSFWCFMNPWPSYVPPRPTDCLTYVAMAVLNSTDEARVCEQAGKFADEECPVAATWKNHGEYVSCVAHAAEKFLAGLPEGGTCPRDPIQSCVVSARANSSIGK